MWHLQAKLQALGAKRSIARTAHANDNDRTALRPARPQLRSIRFLTSLTRFFFQRKRQLADAHVRAVCLAAIARTIKFMMLLLAETARRHFSRGWNIKPRGSTKKTRCATVARPASLLIAILCTVLFFPPPPPPAPRYKIRGRFIDNVCVPTPRYEGKLRK